MASYYKFRNTCRTPQEGFATHDFEVNRINVSKADQQKHRSILVYKDIPF